MPFLTLRACEGCGKSFQPAGNEWTCSECKAKSKSYRRQDDRARDRDDEYRHFLHGTPWRNFSLFTRNQNAQCQVIENGVRCMKPSAVVHHLRDGRQYIGDRLKTSNVVAVCAEHHANWAGDKSQPGRTYAATRQVVNGIETLFEHTA